MNSFIIANQQRHRHRRRLLLSVAVAVLSLGLHKIPPTNAAPIEGTSSSVVQCPSSKTPPIVLEGKRFYNSQTGDYFPIKGMAYYPRPNGGDLSVSNSVDFFTEEFRDRWEEDLTYLRQLGINTIRIYAVDPSKNHDAFFCALQEAGIYVVVELLADCLGCAIGAKDDEADPPYCYPVSLKRRGQYVIRALSIYDNVLAFSAGNEVTIYESQNYQRNAPCQKKFLRDMRAYVDACTTDDGGSTNNIVARRIPIGVINWDGLDRTTSQVLYYACRTDPNDVLESAEWFGLNAYRDCDYMAESIDDLTGFQSLKTQFEEQNLNIPVILSEFGCREAGYPTINGFEAQRTWLPVDALYSPEYSEVFAGGIVFEYSAEVQIVGSGWPYESFHKIQYGVGYFKPFECDHISVPCTYEKYPEFDLLGEKFTSVDTSYMPSLLLTSSSLEVTRESGAIPVCPDDFPAISEFEWPSDEDDEDLLACTATMQPTQAPSEAVSTEPTFIPSANPTTAPTSNPSNTTSQISTNSPSVALSLDNNLDTPESTFSPTNQDSTINPNQETPNVVGGRRCSVNPLCNVFQGLETIGAKSCCPTKDSIWLDCCESMDPFCYDEVGEITLCQTMSTAQYIYEIQTGLRTNPTVGSSIIIGEDMFPSSSDPASPCMFPIFAYCILSSIFYSSILQ